MKFRRLTVATLALVLAGSATASAVTPRTGFETRNGASWTTHQEELDFLAAVAESPFARVDVIGETAQGRPLHLVRLGADRPRSASQARREPTLLYVCSQHGNEPAGREACLSLLRDLAFTTDPDRIDMLERATVLFVPSANPDGRARNGRTNSKNIDINRDHLNLVSEEAQAMARVVRDYRPEAVLDLHEYGPSQPVLYDDDVLLLWPRNLNVHQGIHDEAVELAEQLGTAEGLSQYRRPSIGGARGRYRQRRS
jgi:murein tripeptide amidase MpaA